MMKSSDLEKVETILDKINSLKKETAILNRSKEEGIADACVRINYINFEIDGNLSIKVRNVILDEFNSEMNGYIEELKQLGVEYVDETA